MTKKNIKFYIHHKRFIKVEGIKKSLNLFEKFFILIFNFCYFTGLWVIKLAGKLFTGSVKDILKTGETFPKRLNLIFQKKFIFAVSTLILFAVLTWASISSLHLVAKGIDLKNSLVKTVFLGNAYLNKGKTDLANQDIENAQNSFARAYATFNKGREDISQSGQLLNSLLSVLPQKQATDNLLKAASLVSEAGQDLIFLNTEISSLTIGPGGVGFRGQSTQKSFKNISESLNSASQKINLAAKLVSAVNPNTLPKQNRLMFINLNNQLQNGDLALKNFNSIFSTFINLLSGQKKVLIVFENNNELRATGGFIGTYGALSLKDGQIKNLKISSIYDLDGQLTSLIKPPQPLLNVGPKLFMRNSNWFASFPESAKKLSDFYEILGGQTPDLVIALTPNLIMDFLKITGPISLPNYGVTLTDENFVEQTQRLTTISNDLPTNSPKQMLADLFPIILQRLSKTTPQQLTELVIAIQNELTGKQIVIYSRDEAIQKELAALHWSGELEKTEKDYLAVNSSNLGGTKTDLFVDQNIRLMTNISPDGSITNQLIISRTNKMPDLAGTENLSYIRVFVPFGSRLISNTGFNYKVLDFPDDQKYKIDDDVYAWEKNSVTDNLSQTRIGEEAGKTFFGNWLNVKAGETKTVSLIYQLPFKLSAVDRYSLLLQKQIGAMPSKFNWAINFSGRQIEWKNFDTNELNTNTLNSDILADKDYFFGMVFSK